MRIVYTLIILVALFLNYKVSVTGKDSNFSISSAKAYYQEGGFVCFEGAFFDSDNESNNAYYVDCYYCDLYIASRLWQQSTCASLNRK